MWRCWISPDHNPASTQRRAPNIWAAPVSRAEAQESVRLMACTAAEPTASS